ncbi:MAG: DNA primase [Bacteroidales bacterium]|nr:DNA primase [Bacteroidales bacterium]
MIDQDTIQRIKDTARIEEVIGDFVSLKKRGANHIGCCPFHNEKTPSFYVSPSKGIYKCFGCGEAGDVVKFLEKHEHYTYVESLHWLAHKYNIDVREEELTDEERQRQTERDGLFHVSEFAQRHFADLLWNNDLGRAVGLSYFRKRGMSDAIIERFGLGYCLDEWSEFTDYALANGYSESVLAKTGLTIVNEESGRRHDRFRGRVMFPIYSVSGRVLGFSGRVLSSEKQAAKYVNSPDSDIYNKSRVLYGLFQARSAIAKADKCYLVEGNIDVVSMHQSGVENTVASCGTSLTVEQIRLIRRYTPNVTVLYDGDKAGIKASMRAVDLLFAEGMHVRLVLFPDGDDPDSYAQRHGSTALQEYLRTHEENFIMFKTRVTLESIGGDPIGRATLISDTARSIALVSDLLERSEYIRQCSHLLHVDEEALSVAVGKAAAAARAKAAEKAVTQPAQPAPPADDVEPAEADDPVATAEPVHYTPAAPPAVERRIVALLLNNGNDMLTQEFKDDNGNVTPVSSTVAEVIVGELQKDGLTLSHPLCQRIYEQCVLMLDLTQRIDPSRFVESPDEQLRTFAVTLMMDTVRISDTWADKGVYVPSLGDNLLQEVSETIFTFQSQCLARTMARLRERLRDADPDTQRSLLAELQLYTKASHELGGKRNIIIAPRYRNM